MISDLKDTAPGDKVCVIAGNGPSLRDVPRKLLEKYPSFGTNKVYLLQDLPGWEGFAPTYYVCVDDSMLHDVVPDLVAAQTFKPAHVFLPLQVPFPGAHQLKIELGAAFSGRPDLKCYLGGTVTYVALQLALYMGFKTVLLVGVDHRYAPRGVRPGSKFIASGDDPDHFHPGYFSGGHVYNMWEPQTEVMYGLAVEAYRRAGAKILNLTPGTALTTVPVDKTRNW
jgi:hypothetical protein